MEFLRRYRGLALISLLYAALLGGYILWDRWPMPEPITIVVPTLAPSATSAPIQVYVVGAVARPGVYALAADSRCEAAVQRAGGFTELADVERINLAEPLRDGQQVYVPSRGTPVLELPTPSTRSGAPVAALGGQGLVNINTATLAELDTLPGIGPVLGQRIIDYREAHGPFRSPADIMRVSGIGEAYYERIKTQITVQ
jgi:competence protein ComEA